MTKYPRRDPTPALVPRLHWKGKLVVSDLEVCRLEELIRLADTIRNPRGSDELDEALHRYAELRKTFP